MEMTFTLKALQKHSAVVTALLDGTDCDFAFTGAVAEFEGVETHNWFISRPVSNDEIGIEDSLENLSIPYDRSQRGAQFRPYSFRQFRIDENRQSQRADYQTGDNTLQLLDELENSGIVLAGLPALDCNRYTHPTIISADDNPNETE